MGTHLNVSSLTLLLTVFLLTSNGPTHARSEEAVVDPMTFFVGEWALTLRDAEGNIVGKAKSLGYPVLDGTMLQIDYRSLDPAGNIVFRGTTLRTRKPSGEGWVVRWAMSDL